LHTLRPIDKEAIIQAARKTRGIVVCEEHSAIGGLGASVREILAEEYPIKVLSVGVKNRFGQSGEPEDLLKEYHLTSLDIEEKAETLLQKA